MSGLLQTEYDAGVLTVTINRPEKRNALSRSLIAELAATFTAWKERDDLALAVLTGAGDKAFASGGDLKELSTLRSETQALAFATETRTQLDAIRRFPVPVVAALNGDALGGGAELALACDLRIAATQARIGFLQARLNIATGWGGGSDLFQLVGASKALELLCTTALLEAPRAVALGLLDAVAPVDEDFPKFIEGYLARLMRKPQVMRAFKSLAIMHRFGASPAEKAAAESACFATAWTHDDHWAVVEAMENSRQIERRGEANVGRS